MSSRRTLILIAAVAIGGLAAFTLFRYVNSYTSQVDRDAERVAVWMVKRDIPKGLSGDQAIADGYVRESAIPREFRPTTSLSQPDQIRAQVALTNLSAGQVLVDGMFVAPEIANTGNAGRIRGKDRVAFTISVDQVRGVAGLIVPGDKVNILIDDPRVNAGDGKPPKVLLYQNVEVLFVGQTGAPQAGEAPAESTAVPASGLLTLSVPQAAANKLAYIGGENLYLTLVPPDYEPTDIPPVDSSNVLDGNLTPYPNDEL